MKVSDVMTPECRFCLPEDGLKAIAARMADEGIGAIPVGAGETLVGMVTDRDIVVRALARNDDLSGFKAEDVMSDPVYYCFDDQDCAEVAASMSENRLRRLVVVDRDKRLKGMVTVGDLARADAPAAVAEAEAGIAMR